MSGWFRFYNEALDDPKVQSLDGETFKAWVNLLTLASRNGGKLPSIADIAFGLRCDITVAERYIERLSNGGLIDRLNGGANGYHYAPHNWSKRQYKSDTSTSRVKRFRERFNSVTETPPEAETEADIPSSKDEGAEPDSDKLFWENAKAYLAPYTSNPGALIGKWIKVANGDRTRVARAISDSQLSRAVDPPSYVMKIIKAGAAAEKPDAFWG